MKEFKTIAIASGGTGGHIFPALATAENLMSRGYKVTFFTDLRFHNYARHFVNLTSNEKFSLVVLNTRQSKTGLFAKIASFFHTIKMIYIAFNLLKISKAKLVIGFGSYTSLPVVIGAFFRLIPSILHEQNAFIGLANRISSIFAKVVMTTFPHTNGFYRFTLKKAVLTGMPVRKDILELYYENTNYNINYNAFFRTFDRINIVILGGSQGASIFSKIFPESLKYLNIEIIEKIFVYHQCKDLEVESLEKKYRDLGIKYHINTFFPDAGKLMTMAHLLITRSGAGTLCDLAICGCPSLLVPYKYAKNNHQYLNAKYFYENGSALLLEENEFTPEKVAQVLTGLFSNDQELLTLSQSVKKLAITSAHDKIASIVQTIIGNGNLDNGNDNNPSSIKTNNVGIG
ncbi:undecaprenyldiphospho-muramoylpentapeptide beta-N-acetylglucosaminyltransferase [Candidatus Deianiraea vastatrix]|uniref:UDP-N-acetylglucosamine--N-acetylmuramyl-(pentapeptide) pyrophosphoryl-undecaprenol N-acetylglucosamine transferase n=1 Tax=Candidatus Deianiraea vastatrix TaxID=2163644 RepID=A0A5B8XEL0_9RICK|nr:undecaprenyldiphospho-muramoylpentapeptide beta-N-acetylglucosaminyltransferase [Candidatus Deianiraea vastatrix]QED22844.1 UDP-N-acetylglucosamine--N-acetylmuramyl-(pentapeptide) pyrophosphoryl-undecaprenol N-acetylglucosamine transferase [Candidatus Deianiraea vastatrix]